MDTLLPSNITGDNASSASPCEISPLHKQARKFAEAGMKVFPCVEDGKQPATASGFHDATTELAKIDAWWTENPNYNIGFCPEDAGWCVIDLDPGSETAWLELIAKEGGHDPTYKVRTPRGGRHLYFAGSLPSTASKLAEHVDTRGVGGYVLVPPSVVNGKPYVVSDDREIAPVPEWIAKRIAKAKHTAVDAGDKPLDTDIAVARATGHVRSLVAKGDVAIQGRGGDLRTVALFAQLKDLGVSRDTAIRIVLEQGWNDACQPPWRLDGPPADSLLVKADNGYRYAQNSAGSATDTRTADEAFAGYLEKAKAKEQEKAETANEIVPKWPKPTPYGEVIARTAPPVRELIAGLVQRGKANFLSAPGGSHKSRLLQQWGLCLDAGAKVWDRATERAKFVCLSYEDDGDEITRRSRQITHRLQLPPNSTGELWDLQGRDLPLAIVTEAGEAVLTDFGQHVREHLRSTPGHKFVGIDSCYNALRFVGNAKINEGAVMAAIGALDRICKECDCTMLVLWHPSQAGQERGDASGWSVAWHNAPRARLSLAPVKENDDAYDLKVEKRNYAKAKETLTLYFSDGVLLPRTSIDERQLAGRLSDACVAVATEAAASGKPIQEQRKVAKVWHDKIAASVGYKPTDRAIKDELDRAIAHGLLVYKRNRNGHGGAAGYYPSPVTGPFVERIRVLARWFARWGVEDVSVGRLYRAHALLPADPGNGTQRDKIEGQSLTPDQLAGLPDFTRQFAQAVDADAFGDAGVRPNKRQVRPDYALRPVLLAAMGTAKREAPTAGTVADKVEGEL